MQKAEPQGGAVWGFSSGSGFCMLFKEEIYKKRSHAEGPFACCFKEELCKNQSHAEGLFEASPLALVLACLFKEEIYKKRSHLEGRLHVV